MTPGWVSRTPGASAEWTVESRPPWRYRIRPPSESVRSAPIARLEVDEQAGGMRGGPPVDEDLARPEPEAAPLAGALEERRELAERLVERPAGRLEQRVRRPPAGRVVPLDDDPVALGGGDPLAGALGEPGADRGVVGVAGERQADPVARRLDLRDGTEAGRAQAAAVGGVGRRDLRVGGDDGDAALGQPVGERRHPARRRPRRPRSGSTTGPRGTYALAPPIHRERPEQDERRDGPSSRRTWSGRQPRRGALLRPDRRLVDVAAGRRDRALVPVGAAPPVVASRGQAGGHSAPSAARSRRASAPPGSPWRRRAHHVLAVTAAP